MTKFSTSENKNHTKLKNFAVRLVAVVFWISVWEVVYLIVNRELLIVSPVRVAVRLYELSSTPDFWISAGLSLARISIGFICGVAAGVLFGVITAASKTAAFVFAPLFTIIRATPVASFIILALVWIKSGNVPSFISFLMVTPIVWNNVKTGIEGADTDLVEVAKIYCFSTAKKIRHIYFPSVLPYFSAACITSLGFSWKAGIAAEVLCTPKNSIGRMLYTSKLYLETADLFAWTLVVIILSVILEAILKKLLKSSKNQALK